MARSRATDRVIRAVSLRAGARSVAFVEQRGRELGWVSLVTLAAVVAWFAAEPLAGNGHPISVFVRVMAALGWVAGAWVWLPWNVRVVVDADLRTCEVGWRFLLLPIRRRTIDMGVRSLARGEGILTHVEERPVGERDAVTGCLLALFLGVFASLVAPRKTEKVDVHEQHSGLVLRFGDDTA
ncbi:MAG: hypothetical protein QGG14_09330, partial [Planctomycetota bacterium]|nr:hypothetical protein [Planctomycetota bacterium]